MTHLRITYAGKAPYATNRSNEGTEKPTLWVPCRLRSTKPFTCIWHDVDTLGTSRSSKP